MRSDGVLRPIQDRSSPPIYVLLFHDDKSQRHTRMHLTTRKRGNGPWYVRRVSVATWPAFLSTLSALPILRAYSDFQPETPNTLRFMNFHKTERELKPFHGHQSVEELPEWAKRSGCSLLTRSEGFQGSEQPDSNHSPPALSSVLTCSFDVFE